MQVADHWLTLNGDAGVRVMKSPNPQSGPRGASGR